MVDLLLNILQKYLNLIEVKYFYKIVFCMMALDKPIKIQILKKQYIYAKK